MSIHEINRRAWDALARTNHPFTQPARAEQLRDPLAAIRRFCPPHGEIRGKSVLCLAAGGGKCAVLFAEAGAIVTVVDISPEMLALDRAVAAERRLSVHTIEASIDDLGALPAAGFDLITQPVSTCYVPDVNAVYREVARVTRPGGLYVSQHKQPASLQASARPSLGGYELTEPYYRSESLPPVAGSRHREPGTLEFLHRWEDLVGGLCRAGFLIEDLTEPYHAEDDAEPGSFGHRSRYVAPYVVIQARRASDSGPPATESRRRIELP